MPRIINVKLSIGYPTAVHRDELEVEDDATEADIEQIVNEWAWDYIAIHWEEVKP